MPDKTTGGSVATTTAVAIPTGAALIIIQYLVHPVWPPPDAVLSIVAAALPPIIHFLVKLVMTKFGGSTNAQSSPAAE